MFAGVLATPLTLKKWQKPTKYPVEVGKFPSSKTATEKLHLKYIKVFFRETPFIFTFKSVNE